MCKNLDEKQWNIANKNEKNTGIIGEMYPDYDLENLILLKC